MATRKAVSVSGKRARTADLKSPHHERRARLGDFRSKSGTRMVSLPVLMAFRSSQNGAAEGKCELRKVGTGFIVGLRGPFGRMMGAIGHRHTNYFCAMTSPLPPYDWPGIRGPETAAADRARWIAVLPLAATEQHGPHLPLDTDVLIAEAYLARVRQLLSNTA